MTLFNSNLVAVPTSDYSDIARDQELASKFERLYDTHKPLLDPEFAAEFRRQTPQRATELYFVDWLHTQQLTVGRPTAGTAAAPDWLVSTNKGDRFYVEATCASDGDNNNPNRVVEADTLKGSGHRVTFAVDRTQIDNAFKRISSKLRDKAKLESRPDRLAQAGRAKSEKLPYVVALSTMGFRWPIDVDALAGECPVPHSSLLLRYLFAIGDKMKWRGIQTTDEGQLYGSRQDESERKNGSPVTLGVFLPNCIDGNEKVHYSTVSAVLFTGWSYYRIPPGSRPDVCVVHNPNAVYPLPTGLFKNCVEYTVLERDQYPYYQIEPVIIGAQ